MLNRHILAAEQPSEPQKRTFLYMPKCYPHKYHLHDDLQRKQAKWEDPHLQNR